MSPKAQTFFSGLVNALIPLLSFLGTQTALGKWAVAAGIVAAMLKDKASLNTVPPKMAAEIQAITDGNIIP